MMNVKAPQITSASPRSLTLRVGPGASLLRPCSLARTGLRMPKFTALVSCHREAEGLHRGDLSRATPSTSAGKFALGLCALLKLDHEDAPAGQAELQASP